MVGTLVSQLSKGKPPKEWTEMGSWEYYADNGASVFPQSSQGAPFNAASIAVTGDPLTNLYEDLAAEQKARAAYDNILRLSDDPDVNDVIKFLRQREITHFQRYGEATDLNTKIKPHNYAIFRLLVKYVKRRVLPSDAKKYRTKFVSWGH